MKVILNVVTHFCLFVFILWSLLEPFLEVSQLKICELKMASIHKDSKEGTDLVNQFLPGSLPFTTFSFQIHFFLSIRWLLWSVVRFLTGLLCLVEGDIFWSVSSKSICGKISSTSKPTALMQLTLDSFRWPRGIT